VTKHYKVISDGLL